LVSGRGIPGNIGLRCRPKAIPAMCVSYCGIPFLPVVVKEHKSILFGVFLRVF